MFKPFSFPINVPAICALLYTLFYLLSPDVSSKEGSIRVLNEEKLRGDKIT